MSYRSDYTGPQVDSGLRRLIAKVGGLNPYGEPNYRVVHTFYRTTPSGGTWIDWADELETDERNEGVNRPIRSVAEVRQVLAYPNWNGWVLEKWVSAESFGSPQRWYLPISQGGTMIYLPEAHKSLPSLGDYPFRGDYEHFNYLFTNESLTEAVVINAIHRIERGIGKLPRDPEKRVLLRIYNAMMEEERKVNALRIRNKEILDSGDYAFKGSPFIGYGAKRAHSSKEHLKRAGITSHHID